jgi:hypothetical protein
MLSDDEDCASKTPKSKRINEREQNTGAVDLKLKMKRDETSAAVKIKELEAEKQVQQIHPRICFCEKRRLTYTRRSSSLTKKDIWLNWKRKG